MITKNSILFHTPVSPHDKNIILTLDWGMPDQRQRESISGYWNNVPYRNRENPQGRLRKVHLLSRCQ